MVLEFYEYDEKNESIENSKESKLDGVGPHANLLPRGPQPSMYGPEGKAIPGNPEEYEKTQRPIVPSQDYKTEKMFEQMDQMSEMYKAQNNPENIIAGLQKEIEEHRTKILGLQSEVLILDQSEQENRNKQHELNILNGKISKRELKIGTLEKTIKIVEETGKLPDDSFFNKSKVRDHRRAYQEQLVDTLQH